MYKKSSYSNADGPCVEVDLEHPTGKIMVRDTKDHGLGPELGFTPAEWRVFARSVEEGEFALTCCQGSGWVCEEHPDQPFEHTIPTDDGGPAVCAGPGEPCPTCNGHPDHVAMLDGSVLRRVA